MSRIANIAIVALLALAAVASTAQAGEAGYVDFTPENSPAPDQRHVVLYGETAEDFLAIYAEALANGFTWLTAPARTYIRELEAEYWMVMGYLHPENMLTNSHDIEQSGRFEHEGQVIQFDVIPILALTAEEMLGKLQIAFENGLRALTLPRLTILPGTNGQVGWAMDALLLSLAEDVPSHP